MITWEYGVTTVPQRIDHVLPRTLRSLEQGGFYIPQDRIFVDGPFWPNLPKAVYRDKPIGQFGNYLLALWELYLRNPNADYYALFEDDIVMCKNVRQYVESTMSQIPGYLNMYTSQENWDYVQASFRTVHVDPTRFPMKQGWHCSDRRGRGAMALVFTNWQLQWLLSHNRMMLWPLDAHLGKKGVDRAISQTFENSRYVEMVHNPSLVQHVGEISTVDKNKVFTQSPVFAGEDFDAMELLK